MKLFVWDGVLTDYASGIMFAVASSVEDARAELRKAYSYIPDDDLEREPKVYRLDRKTCRAVWGGG